MVSRERLSGKSDGKVMRREWIVECMKIFKEADDDRKETGRRKGRNWLLPQFLTCTVRFSVHNTRKLLLYGRY